MLKRIISLLPLIMCFACKLYAQTIVPSIDLQQQMCEEECTFLSQMDPLLQHRQSEAIKVAMQGDTTALMQIRRSRNQAPTINDGVKMHYVSPTLCLFLPKQDEGKLRPLLVYFHGGGWCFGSINSCAKFCAEVACAANCGVLAVDYRLAPAYPFPAALNDCVAAYQFARSHATEWGIDATHILVGGDSAGGQLALATALSEPSVRAVIPIYPVTKLYAEPTPSWQQYAQGYGNDAELMHTFNRAYAGQQTHHPLASVALAPDSALTKLPPVLFIAAGHDVLYDQGRAFVSRLVSLHHPVEDHVFPTATHLFITVPGQPTAFAEAVKIVASYIRKN